MKPYTGIPSTLFLFLLSLFVLHSTVFAAENVSVSQQQNSPSHKIAVNYSELCEYILKLLPETANLSKASKVKMQKQFRQTLEERFSLAELNEIDAIHQKIGGENLVKMLDIFMKSFGHIVKNKAKLQDTQLNISPSFDALQEKKFAEEKLDDKLKSFYIQDHAKDTAENRNLSAEAHQFAVFGKKIIKKTLSDNFSEEQYRLSYEFEHSELGKRLSDAFEESMAKILANS